MCPTFTTTNCCNWLSEIIHNAKMCVCYCSTVSCPVHRNIVIFVGLRLRPTCLCLYIEFPETERKHLQTSTTWHARWVGIFGVVYQLVEFNGISRLLLSVISFSFSFVVCYKSNLKFGISCLNDFLFMIRRIPTTVQHIALQCVWNDLTTIWSIWLEFLFILSELAGRWSICMILPSIRCATVKP